MPRCSGCAPGGYRVVGLKNGHGLIRVLNILADSQADLPAIGDTDRPAGIFADLLEDGEQNCREDRNDGDHDEQFDQRKALTSKALTSEDWANRFHGSFLSQKGRRHPLPGEVGTAALCRQNEASPPLPYAGMTRIRFLGLAHCPLSRHYLPTPPAVSKKFMNCIVARRWQRSQARSFGGSTVPQATQCLS